MLVLVLSDIHANLTALEAVLSDAGSYDAVWCLGDTIGYGPDPNECLERLQSLPNLQCLIGNHDQAALGLIPITRFNQDARQATTWTQAQLTPSSQEFLRGLHPMMVIDDFTLAHGSPRDPVWEYIADPYTADRNFDAFETDYCLVGHSHLPLMFHRPAAEAYALPMRVGVDETVFLQPRMIINPGSVGQPRDLNPQSGYALLDLEAKSWKMQRVAYDVTSVQLRILQAGLPERQALRLAAGW